MSASRKAIDQKASQIRSTLMQWRGKESRAKASIRIGVVEKTLYRWEKGDVDGIEGRNVVAIARAYGRPLEEVVALLGVETPMSSHVPRGIQAVREPAPSANSDEFRFLIESAREKAVRYLMEKRTGAPDYKLKPLLGDVEASVRYVLERSATDSESLAMAVDTITKMMTGYWDLAPLKEEQVKSASRAQRHQKP